MKLGVTLMFLNYGDWSRYYGDPDADPAVSDADFYRDQLATGDLVEPLGFDSLWTVEHHFTPYCMVPDPLQMLTYFAGRTKRIDFGSMVVVLPWHHPIRVAEQVTLLDNMLGDRNLTCRQGQGRRQAREFDGFGVDMADTRELFQESVEILQRALTSNRFSYSGKHYQISDMTLRPRPQSATLAERMVCSWMSPQSLEIAAHLGLGMLFITGQKPIEGYVGDVEKFNAIRAEHGWKPLRPTHFSTLLTAPRIARTRFEGATRFQTNYFEMSTKHYQFGGSHFEKTGRLRMVCRYVEEDEGRANWPPLPRPRSPARCTARRLNAPKVRPSTAGSVSCLTRSICRCASDFPA